MAQYKYSTRENTENMARAVGRDLPVSTKQAIEICNTLRGMSLERAKTVLENVKVGKEAIAYEIFDGGVGHRKGKIGAGRYPKKACSEILSLLESVEANAQNKGLSTAGLKIIHINAQKAATQWHYGRQRRVSMKRTHIEVVVEEKTKGEGKKEKKAPAKDKAKEGEKKEGVNVEAKEKAKEENKGRNAPAKEDKKDGSPVEKKVEDNHKEGDKEKRETKKAKTEGGAE